MKKQSLSISENTSPTAEQQENLPEKGQNHSKIYKKLIIHTVIAVILGILMITHDSEVLTASEKFMIFTCTVLSAVLLRIEPFLKEWLEKDSGKESIHFLKNGIGEIFSIICAFILIATTTFGFRSALNFMKEKCFSHNSYEWFFSDDIMPKSWLIGNTPATVAGCFSGWTSITTLEDVEDISNIPMNETVTANYIQIFLSFGHPDILKIPETYAQKIADFLNTPIKSPIIRFFWKWFFCILLVAICLCIHENIGFPALVKANYPAILTGAIAIGSLIGGIFIFPIFLMYIVTAASIVTGIAGFLLFLWGIFLPVIIILNFIISILLFFFEKIKETFSKDKAEPFVS